MAALQPQRYEKFVVPDGVKKVSFVKDTKVPNAARFVFEREDHTVGNVLRMCAPLPSPAYTAHPHAAVWRLVDGSRVHDSRRRRCGCAPRPRRDQAPPRLKKP
jgi:hypothetical protein